VTRPGPLCLAVLAAAVLSALPASARAQEFHENVRHPCQDFAFLTRREIYDCLQRDLAAADAELNREYQRKMRELDGEARDRLLQSQRAWLERYDRVLTSYYSRGWANHSMVKVLPSQIQAVRDRTAWVRGYRG
jgi:uncharacterized protein YecT (DUF1311 family)